MSKASRILESLNKISFNHRKKINEDHLDINQVVKVMWDGTETSAKVVSADNNKYTIVKLDNEGNGIEGSEKTVSDEEIRGMMGECKKS